MAKKTLDALIDSLGTKQRPFLDQLTKEQRGDFDRLVERHRAGTLNVSWIKLTAAMREHWGLPKLASNTLRSQIEKASKHG